MTEYGLGMIELMDGMCGWGRAHRKYLSLKAASPQTHV
ncbi:hypothetical protein [Cohnella sp. GCM10012308]